MPGFEQLLPFGVIAIVTIWAFATTLRQALPAIAALREEMASAPATRELRHTSYSPNYVSRINVVSLPVTPRVTAPSRGRAAA